MCGRRLLALALAVLALATVLLAPVHAYADSMEMAPREKSGYEESMSVNKWKTGTFTTAQSTTGYWYPDVYKFTVSTSGTYSLMLETQSATYKSSGLILMLADYYKKDSSGTSIDPIGWIGVTGVPMGYCLEVTLEPGTYWIAIGDAHDIYYGIKSSSNYNVETFSDDIYSFLNGYNFDGAFVGSYRVGIFSRPAGSVPVYRMYNTRTSEHLYTKSVKEYNSCGIGNYRDWRQEGIAWYAPKSSSTPVYRLYNKGLLVHHYTSNKNEKNKLVSQYGWRDEGVAFYSDDAHGMPLYRLYNGNIKPPQHHYTSSAGERDSLVKKYGWRYESVGFYGMKR